MCAVISSAETLLEWVDAPLAEKGVYVSEASDWRFHPYAQLADRVRGVSAQLREAAIRRGEVVAIVDERCVDFLAAFFGTLHAGATPLPIPPASALRSSSYVEHVAGILAVASPAAVVSVAPWGEELLEAAGRPGSRSRLLHVDPVAIGELDVGAPAVLALLQFTSGSTEQPRGVCVTPSNLASNIAMIRRWLDWGAEDMAASWLPLHHDMGLVGLFLTSVCSQTSMWKMSPREFMLAPARWLECFGVHGATITASPTFGYAYVTRRVQPRLLSGMDFSGWRNAVVGAERVMPSALASFAGLLREHGFRPETLLPAYGLAEATLAVSGQPRETPARSVPADWSALRVGRPVPVGRSRPITGETDVGSAGAIASCGRPLDGIEVSVADESGNLLPEGSLGEIVVEGPSVAAGYIGDQNGGTRFEGSRLCTGDVGFMLYGELFMVGRIADRIKVRGRYIYVEALEAKIAESLGLSPHRCIVVPAPEADADAVTVVLEPPDGGDWTREVCRVARSQLGPSISVKVCGVEPETIARTTSGKPRRREMWRRLRSGELVERLVFSAAEGATQ